MVGYSSVLEVTTGIEPVETALQAVVLLALSLLNS